MLFVFDQSLMKLYVRFVSLTNEMVGPNLKSLRISPDKSMC